MRQRNDHLNLSFMPICHTGPGCPLDRNIDVARVRQRRQVNRRCRLNTGLHVDEAARVAVLSDGPIET